MISISTPPRISIVIPNYNGAAYLEKCLSSLLRQDYPSMEILVVENASTDASVDVIRRVAPSAQILPQQHNLGFAGGANAGIRQAKGEWVAILNNDTEASVNWLAECASAIERHPDAAFIACKIFDFNRRDLLFSAGDCILRAGIGYRRGQESKDLAPFQKEIEMFSACGCAALYRKSVLEEADGFEERFFAYLEDVDLGLRLQEAGHRGYYAPRAEIYHHGSGTSGGEFSPLAVRLRTRNSILLLVKSIPARVLWRCLPMIAAAQAAWLTRAIMRRRGLSYLHGIIGVFPLLPAMLKKRKNLRRYWQASTDKLWQSILQSEALAREEFVGQSGARISSFLRWYFRFF